MLLGANAQGKTNLLEAIYYPVLFRSFRGAPDQEVTGFGGPGFQVEASVEDAAGRHASAPATCAAGRRKRILVDGDEPERLADAVGRWLAVVVSAGRRGAGHRARRGAAGVSRPAALARRPASICGRCRRYRAALAQRNSALRQGRPELARAFDAPLAAAGAAGRAPRGSGGPRRRGEQFARRVRLPGRAAAGASLRYRGRRRAGRPGGVGRGAGRRAAGGPGPGHDHGGPAPGRPRARDRRHGRSGSSARTGQQRSAAVALKLIELATLRDARGTEPALLLDDVFAELDGERQRAARRPAAGGRGPAGVPHGAAARRAAGGPGAAGLASATTAEVRSDRERDAHAAPRSPTRWRATSSSPASPSGCSRRASRAVGRAGRAADRRGHRARVGHAGRGAPGPRRHRGVGQRAEPDGAPDPGPAQRRAARDG